MISGFYGGDEFTSPSQANDYVSSKGLHIAATYDPEGFWGVFSEYIPSNVIIDLSNMKILYLANVMDANQISHTLDNMLGL